MSRSRSLLFLLAAACGMPAPRPQPEPRVRSPIHLVLSRDGSRAYVANHTASSISLVDLRSRRVIDEIPVGERPAHLALSPDERALYVTCLWDRRVDVVDLAQRRVVRSFSTGLEPYGCVLSPDGSRLFVVNAISDTVSTIDASTGRTLRETAVGRQPRYAAPAGPRLLVANGLSRDVSILDDSGRVVETRDLGRASILRQIACSPDGRWAFVAHLLSHDEQVTSQIERGWIHSNGFSVLDLSRPGHRVTLLLDRLLDGAANPWGLVLSDRRMYVTLAGVHEVAIVDVPGVLRLVSETAPDGVKPLQEDVEILARRGLARRVSAGGLGPRGLALSPAGEIVVSNHFSDTVTILDAETGALRATIPLGPPVEPTLHRRGEILFNDARLCHQRWFSCASCHQEDATVDGLNWDLLNDGAGNAKNAKSLHDIHDTPPAMWTQVREDMDAAVAAGQRFGGFLPDPENHRALMAFLNDPPRAPNPYPRLARGERAFDKAGCGFCHPAPTFTDRKLHDIGTANATDLHREFDTPSLRECYRTAPYVHDGRAKTLRDVFTTHDKDGLHGGWTLLSPEEFEDLLRYLMSL